MNIISVDFILNILILLLVFFLTPQKFRWIIMLLGSIYMYYQEGILPLAFLLIESTVVYLMGISISKRRKISNTKCCSVKLIVYSATILVSGCLVIVKLLGPLEVKSNYFVIPLGISYITFQLISYVVDIYWEKHEAEYNYLRFLLFVFYFPKMMQGPIERYETLSATLYGGGEGVTYQQFSFGIQRMIYGYFKKLVIADRLAIITNTVFQTPENYSGSILILVSFMGAVQLYCDFSGYMDIVLGLSEMFGIKMKENFKHPFFSKSASEFWRRWHITLGLWFKDYVYNTVVMSHYIKRLGKWCRKNINKRFGNAIMKMIALLCVWLLTGLWHGTGINYIIWGLIWGGLIIFSTIFDKEIELLTKLLRINTQTYSWKLWQMIRTNLIFIFGIALTRLNGYGSIKIFFYKIIHEFRVSNIVDGTISNLGLTQNEIYLVVISVILVLVVSILQENMSVRELILKQNLPVRWIIYSGSVIIVIMLGIYGKEFNTSGFAYAHF